MMSRAALHSIAGFVNVVLVALVATSGSSVSAEPSAERVDYLTFAQGAIPLRIGGAGAAMGVTFEHAVRMVDGNPTGFSVVTGGTAETVTTFLYELPAATSFDRFGVPQVLETPSPSTTFTREVEVYGSATGPDSGFERLARATLETHAKKGMFTELTIEKTTPVRWVEVRLTGGIYIPKGVAWLEFSEIVGNGRQGPAPFADHFHGLWKARANVLELRQDGAVVAGCYDRSGDLAGTVSGRVLRATGVDRSDKTKSVFILSVAPDGVIRGVRSTNGGPFRLTVLPTAPKGTKGDCPMPAVKLGCGSIIHGISFDFDSASIRTDAEPVLSALFAGLKDDPAASITIEGHTSSEGTTEYNQGLSDRRAQAVVADLARRGIADSRLRAVGVGELRPLASNDDESGRSLNRRVEVICK
jgi:OOP family OmpA-OmpF porin